MGDGGGMGGAALKLAVIADDYTGAADTGIQFRGVAAPLYLFSRPGRAPAAILAGAGGVCLSSESRNVPRREACARVGQAAALLAGRRPGLVYKKVDSCLRGHPGAEAAALMAALDLPAAIVCPAYPAMGRTVRDGLLLVNGTPVAESEMASDPLAPVRHSRVRDILAEGCGLKGGQVPLATVEAGGEELAVAVKRLLDSGCRLISFDAVEQKHLVNLAALLLARFPQAMPMGSAGLAMGLAAEMPRQPQPPQNKPKRGPAGFLYVCGSASPVMASQVEPLRTRHHCPVLYTPAGQPQTGQPGFDSLGRQLAENMRRGAAVVAISPGNSGNARLALRNLAGVVGRAMEIAQAWGLFLSGGDTAHAILSDLRVSALELCDEPAPGLVESLARGGPGDGLTIVTKAGAFGGRDALCRLHQKLFSLE